IALRRGGALERIAVGANAANDQFLIGSISKHFTAVAVLLVQRDGKLAVSDAIVRFLPELAQFSGVTIAMLLTHTGGLPRDFHPTPHFMTPDDALLAARAMK